MRGLERNIVILDRRNYAQSSEPAITRIVRYGNGWIEVKMTDGHTYRRSGGTLSWRYNNPGNIKIGQFARAHKAIGRGWGGHAVFPTYKIGKWAKKQLLFTPIRRYYNLSVRKALSYYAPVNDRRANNRPDIYARYIVNRVPGITLNTILKTMNPTQQDQMLTAMERFEGYRAGRIDRI